MGPEAVGQRIVRRALALCGTRGAFLYRVDPRSGRLALEACAGDAVDPLSRTPFVDLAVVTGSPVATDDFLADPRVGDCSETDPRLTETDQRAVLCVPLRVDDDTVGVLAVTDATGRVFESDLLRLLDAFADQAGVALHLSHLHRQTSRQLTETKLVLAVSQAVGAVPHPTEILRRTLRELGRSLGADTAGAWLLESGLGCLVVCAGSDVAMDSIDSPANGDGLLDDALIDELTRRRGPISTGVEDGDPALDLLLARLLPHKSIVVQPVWRGDELTGVVAIAWLSDAHRITADELRLVEAMADRLSASLDSIGRRRREVRRADRPEHSLAPAAIPAREGQGVFDTIALAAATLTGGKLAIVWVVDDRDHELWPEGRHAASPALTRLTQDLTAVADGERAIREIFASGSPRYVSDIRNDPRWASQSRLSDGVLRAVVEMPLIAGDRAVGILSVFFGDRGPVALEERETLDLVATHAALAIENARALVEADRRRRAAESLAGVGPRLSQSLHLEDVGQRIVDSVRLLVGALRTTLVQVEPDTGSLRLLAVSGEEAFPLGPGIASLAIRDRSPLITADLLADPRITLAPEVRSYLERVPIRAVLSVPLIVGDLVIGALSVGDRRGRVFDHQEVQLLEAFADQAAIAVHNAQLYAETTRQQHEAVALEQVAREITSSLERDEVFRRIVDHGRELCRSDMAFLTPFDREAGTAAIVAASGPGSEALMDLVITPGRGAGGRVLATGEPFVTEDYARDDRISGTGIEIPASVGVEALAVVPLRFRGVTTGLLWVVNRHRWAFTPRDLRVLGKLADHAAVAQENSRLYARAQELGVHGERVRLAAELHDTLSQILFSVALKLDWCLHRLHQPEVAARVAEIKRDTGYMMSQIRDLIWRLSHDQGDEGSVSDHLKRLIRQFRELTRLPVEFVEQGDLTRLGRGERDALVKALREALANIAKHARASRAAVRIEVRAHDVLFEVTDDGVGPPPGGLGFSDSGHFGLRQMLERIEALGGSLDFERGVPTGFFLRGVVPLR